MSIDIFAHGNGNEDVYNNGNNKFASIVYVLFTRNPLNARLLIGANEKSGKG